MAKPKHNVLVQVSPHLYQQMIAVKDDLTPNASMAEFVRECIMFEVVRRFKKQDAMRENARGDAEESKYSQTR